MVNKIEISHKTIIFAVLFLISIWFLYYIREILFIFFVALLTMTILNPAVTRITKFKIPRGVAVFLVYLFLLGVVGVAVAGVIPPLVEQSAGFANSLPGYLANIGLSSAISEQVLKEVVTQLGSLPGQIIKFGVVIFSNIIAVVTVLIFTFYLLIARNKADGQLASFLGERNSQTVLRILDNIEIKLGGWARGEMALMLLVGCLNFFGLTILGIPFALPLAILAGVLEIVPNLGPTLAAVPAVVIGFGLSPLTGVATIALAFLIQQVENYLFVPKVMEKSVGVNPVITLLALAIGFKLAGVIGVLVSVPVFITIQAISKEFLLNK